MRSTQARLAGARITEALATTLFVLAASACAGEDPMTGTWADPDATTTLPSSLGGGELAIDATVVLDANVAPATFDMTLELAALGLTDVIHARGTYEEDSSNLTLTFTGFVIDPASGGSQSVGADGAQCIVLAGFADTPVCFRGTQTNPYALEGDTFTVTLAHEIAGNAESETVLNLTRVAE